MVAFTLSAQRREETAKILKKRAAEGLKKLDMRFSPGIMKCLLDDLPYVLCRTATKGWPHPTRCGLLPSLDERMSAAASRVFHSLSVS
jgi:hypothetical protein